ncbi:MAG: malonyl-ACP O-methyltransferase BioC [Gammaproteobacteria bacterium]|nr:malonyl-ACP O-methyltransferase BioC [Gammaproteobacteria bacterium]
MNQYQLEKKQIIRGFDRAAPAYQQRAVLPRRVRELLLERLDYLQIEPRIIADMGAGTGAAAHELCRRYPDSGVFALDFSPGMIDQIDIGAANIKTICADALNTPLPDQSVDLLFSNLMLPWCHDLDSVLKEFARLMAPGGALSFSTFGPDTLLELRRAWRQVDESEHVHAFFDMHDVGDALARAGFAEPVMDVERFTLTYKTLPDLLLDLRHMGSLNALPGRRRSLLGRGQAARLQQAYESSREHEVLPATFEIIFAQAWAPVPSATVTLRSGETNFPLSKIGRRGKDE